MYRLYYAPGAASLVVHWMLLELGVSHELVRVNLEAREQKSPGYLALNPNGQVPTLVIDDAPHCESAALLMLLAERHSEAGLQPPPADPRRPAYVELMFYLANTLLPAFRTWFYAADFASTDSEDDVREHARRRIEAAFDRLDRKLADGRPFLVGEQLSAADFLATMLMRWSRNMPKPAERWPHLASYSARMRARPALREVHAREGLTDWIESGPSLQAVAS